MNTDNKAAETYIILDWAYNVKFGGKEFTEFEDAWVYLECNIDKGELLEDFIVLTKDEVEQ